jgi:uncharacterized protein
MSDILYLAPLFFLTALLYSTAGFGGGSTYLALLLLFQFPYTAVPKIALICNLIVVSGGLYHYVRERLLPVRRVLPFVVASIPCAFLGGRIPIAKELFLALAALSLGIAGVRLLFVGKGVKRADPPTGAVLWSAGLGAGGIFGFVGGLVGIGGGIFLAPLLYFLRWGEAREIAAMSSFFIFVNSFSGLLGQFQKSGFTYDIGLMLPLGGAVLLGGQIGTRLSIGHLSPKVLQRITALLVLWVAGGIVWKFL